MNGLAIREVAARTGIAAPTIRMWEQRFGFPRPERTKSGYRRYTEEDVEVLRRVLAYRKRGLSVPAALERARAAGGPTDRPSIYAAVAAADGIQAHVLRKSTLKRLSRAIEDEALARAAGPVIFGAFQREAFYRAVRHRWSRLAAAADAAVVFADFAELRSPAGQPVELPIGGDALGNEWAVIVDAPGYAACLLAWELPGRAEPGGDHDDDRRFECAWTIDPDVTRRAALVAASLAGRRDAGLGEELEALLADRPLAVESPAPGLTALTNRIVGYLEAA
jgi:DNA-binding transcriptional MerR regulator